MHDPANGACRLDDPSLAWDGDLERARRLLAAYAPGDAEQERRRRRMLAFIAEHPNDAHLRSCRPGHLTASALVVDAARRKTLLTHHRKLDRWLQLGGHCDGDANLPAVALREASEESGLSGLVIEPAVIDLDIHPIPARPGEPEHLHFDTRFVVIAPNDMLPRGNHESRELRWLSAEEASALDLDESVKRLLRLILRPSS